MKFDRMNAAFRSALVGCIAVGGTTTLIVAFAFAPGGGVPPPAVGMFGLLGGVLGVIAGAVAGSSESGGDRAVAETRRLTELDRP
jgi:peptidoglycan/LPS O-acetylase OafA/YrhL